RSLNPGGNRGSLRGLGGDIAYSHVIAANEAGIRVHIVRSTDFLGQREYPAVPRPLAKSVQRRGRVVFSRRPLLKCDLWPHGRSPSGTFTRSLRCDDFASRVLPSSVQVSNSSSPQGRVINPTMGYVPCFLSVARMRTGRPFRVC